MCFAVAARIALAAVLTAALVGNGVAHDEPRFVSDGAISVAQAAIAASSSVAVPPVLRAPLQLKAVFIAVAQATVEPACARPLPAPVAPDAQPLRPDVVPCPSQGPPAAG